MSRKWCFQFMCKTSGCESEEQGSIRKNTQNWEDNGGCLPAWTRQVAGNVIKLKEIIVSSSVLLKNAIAFFKTKCIENLCIKKLLDTIFNHKAMHYY